jgi:hypothetical protein
MVDANRRPDFPAPDLACLTRQKCDEQREEGDACRTCRRLQLDCLGWGPRRPDWMRVRHRPSSPPFGMMTHTGANVTGQGGRSSIQDEYQVSPAEVGAHPWPASNFTHRWLVRPSK